MTVHGVRGRMPAYIVTYKFGRSGDFGRRMDAFMIRLQVGDWWGETGSSMIVHSDEPIDAFCRRILSPACFDRQHDLAVIVDLDNREGRASGPFRGNSLFMAAPWIRRF